MLAYVLLGQVVRVFCEVLILSGASYRTRFVFFVWLVDPSGSTQILVSAPVVEGEKIYIFFPCTLPFLQVYFPILHSFVENWFEEGCLGSLLLVPPRGAGVSLFPSRVGKFI